MYLDLGEGDNVVVAVEFRALGAGSVVEIDFVSCVHGFDPLRNVLKGTLKNFRAELPR